WRSVETRRYAYTAIAVSSVQGKVLGRFYCTLSVQRKREASCRNNQQNRSFLLDTALRGRTGKVAWHAEYPANPEVGKFARYGGPIGCLWAGCTVCGFICI